MKVLSPVKEAETGPTVFIVASLLKQDNFPPQSSIKNPFFCDLGAN